MSENQPQPPEPQPATTTPEKPSFFRRTWVRVVGAGLAAAMIFGTGFALGWSAPSGAAGPSSPSDTHRGSSGGSASHFEHTDTAPAPTQSASPSAVPTATPTAEPTHDDATHSGASHDDATHAGTNDD